MNIKYFIQIILVILLCLAGQAASATESSVHKYDFKQFAITELFQGEAAPVDINSHSSAIRFRTRLTQGAKQGPNFAGHYTVVEWGCGTNCQQLAIVDATSGKVCDWISTELGSLYQLESNLFIANPDIVYCSQFDWCETKYYQFNDGQFEPLGQMLSSQ